MSRPTKIRRVAFLPELSYFKPARIPMRILEEVTISVEEAEAIRLKDIEGMDQENCAEKMNISRQTFQRVLSSARQKIADALLNGKAIRIDGGNFEMAMRHFRCHDGHEWEVPFEVMIAKPPEACPSCNTPDILSLEQKGFGWGKRGRGRHGRGDRGNSSANRNKGGR
jgi:predicted DNA-binding protein (UPF0251 family)